MQYVRRSEVFSRSVGRSVDWRLTEFTAIQSVSLQTDAAVGTISTTNIAAYTVPNAASSSVSVVLVVVVFYWQLLDADASSVLRSVTAAVCAFRRHDELPELISRSNGTYVDHEVSESAVRHRTAR